MSTQPHTRDLYTVPEAMFRLSIGRSVIYELIRAGTLMSVTVGRSRRIPATAIDTYITHLITESREDTPHDRTA